MPQKRLTLLIAMLCLFTLTFSVFAELDKTKYITVDEIHPGDEAYCLTVYKGVGIERFELKVIDVVKDIQPGRDAILVVGTTPRFIHTGPVAGCSGSPVYINGRLAGALAFGWSFVKDPLYGVTPIAEMLRAGDYEPSENAAKNSSAIAADIDYSAAVNLRTAYEQTINVKKQKNSSAAMSNLICPVATTLPQSCLSEYSDQLESLGMMAVSGGSSGRMAEYKDVPLTAGSIIAVPLAYGDIELSAIGTVTEVVGDKVYGFGHSFLGEGPIEVPMATGYVHTVVANVARSFKFGQSIDVKGSLYADESTAIVGKVGKMARTIPTNITVDHFGDKQIRRYNCQIATHRYFTPLIAAICVSGSSQMVGSLPADNSVYYKTKIGIDGYEPIEIENFSSASYLSDCIQDSIGAIGLIVNNPYEKCAITSLDFEVKIIPESKISHIWSFDISDSTVQPGQVITASTTIESYLGGHKKYQTELKIPENIEPGRYEISLIGANDYANFKINSAMHKYTPENLASLVKIINEIANIKRDSLHLIMTLPPSGLTIEGAELPQLPGSKALLLNNSKRSNRSGPSVRWIEKTIKADTILVDSRTLEIVVENK